MAESTAAVLLLVFLAIGCSVSENNLKENENLDISIVSKTNVLLQRQTCENNSSACPPWAFCDDTTRICQCGTIPGDALKCDLLLRPYILDCFCATVVGNMTEVGQCNYNCVTNSKNQVDTVYQQLPSNRSSWNDFMCKEFGRSGTLCGQCDKERNYYPRAYSFDLSCIQCDGSMSSNLWKYIALAYLPLTFFYLLVFFLRADINSSQLQGFIFFSQFISAPPSARNILLATRKLPICFGIMKLLLAFYGVWNLDFFRAYDNNICFRISSLNISLLDLGVAIYPLMLMLVTYLLVQLYDCNYKPVILLTTPFLNCLNKLYKEFSVKRSLINLFTTFLFLANIKFFNIGLDILNPVKVYQFQFNTPNKMNTTLRLYYDSTVEYFGLRHILHAITSLVFMVFIIFPVLLVFFYPLRIFQNFLSLFPLRWQLSLHIFFDSFQGCYKDGTEPGIRDCRWFGPLLYFIRIIFLVVYAFTLDAVFFPFAAIMITLLAIVTINADPFKPHLQHLATTMVVFILLIDVALMAGVGSIIAKETSDTNSSYIFYMFAVLLSLLPPFYVAYIVLLLIVRHCKLKLHKK